MKDRKYTRGQLREMLTTALNLGGSYTALSIGQQSNVDRHVEFMLASPARKLKVTPKLRARIRSECDITLPASVEVLDCSGVSLREEYFRR